MPYVRPGEGLNLRKIDLADIRGRFGPAPWRVAPIGTDAVRFVLLAWPPGFATVPHFHPRGVEVFQVLAGRAAFRFGDAPRMGETIEAGTGAFLVSPPGEWHDIRVLGTEEFYMLIAVAPNEDAPDEAVEATTDGLS